MNSNRNGKSQGGDELAGFSEACRGLYRTNAKLSVGDNCPAVTEIRVSWRSMADEDMPYMPDGTPVEIVLNPLGVPRV
jgi:DNA-directed RNA polymerase subunit beta